MFWWAMNHSLFISGCGEWERVPLAVHYHGNWPTGYILLSCTVGPQIINNNDINQLDVFPKWREQYLKKKCFDFFFFFFCRRPLLTIPTVSALQKNRNHAMNPVFQFASELQPEVVETDQYSKIFVTAFHTAGFFRFLIHDSPASVPLIMALKP